MSESSVKSLVVMLRPFFVKAVFYEKWVLDLYVQTYLLCCWISLVVIC